VARVVSLMGLGWSASWTRLKWALLCSAAPLARDANNHISRWRVDPIERKQRSLLTPQVRSRFRVPPLPSSNELRSIELGVRFGRYVRISRPSRCIRSVFDPGCVDWLSVLIW
jgi:hypothetical protein